jgi:hypothetical protein
MAEWKKVIVSGSIAELAQVTSSDGINIPSLAAGTGTEVLTIDTDGNVLSVLQSTIQAEAYTAGTNITLTGQQFNVDDAFIKNNANDTTTGIITAAGFSGPLTGNADTATSATDATNAANIYVSSDETGDTNNPILFANAGGNSNRAVYEDSTLYYNNTSNILYSTTFAGALTGNADTATSATDATNAANIYVSSDETGDTNNPILFANAGGNSNRAVYEDSTLYFDNTSNILYSTTFAGALTGNADTATTATNATNVYVSSDETGDTNCPIVFTANSTAGNKPLYEDSGLYFNNTSNILYSTTFAGALTGNADTATSATDATNAANIYVSSDDTGDTNNPILFANAGGNSNRAVYEDSTLYFDNTSNILHSTTFAGALTGNASTATEATNVTVTDAAGGYTDGFITFVDGATGTQGIDTSAGLTYNPYTNALATTTITAASSVSASTVNGVNANFQNLYVTGSAQLQGNLVFNGLQFTEVGANTITGSNVFGTVDNSPTNTHIFHGHSMMTGSLSVSGNITGDLTGNADTATSATDATNASKLYINNDDTGDANNPILFTATSTAGNKSVYEDSALYFDNTSNILYSTTFAGALTGNADTATSATSATDATNASKLYINNDDTGDTNNPILFTANSTAGNKSVYEDSALYFDNTSNILYSTTFAGALTGNADTVTDGVYIAGTQTITGTKTFDSLTVGSNNKITFANGNDYIRYDDTNTTGGAGRFHFDADGGTNNASVQAQTFYGALVGNADTATDATNASKLYINSDETGDTNCPILFTADSTAGNKSVYEDSGLYFNNTSNILYSTTFAGALTGNADTATTATNATNVYVSSDDTGDANCPIVFTANSSAGNKPLYEDSALYFDNTSNILYSTKFDGALVGNADTATTAGTVSDNAIGLAQMAGGTDGNLITYNSSGDPAHVATGTSNQVLTSNGAGSAPSFQNIQNTDVNVSDANLRLALAALEGNDVNIGDSGDDVNVIIRGNLQVDGTTTTVDSTNVTIVDPFLLLGKGATDNTDFGIVFGDSGGTSEALVWDGDYNNSDGRLGIASGVAASATGATPSSYLVSAFAGNADDAETAKVNHVGNIRIESSEIYIYV